MHMFYWQPSLYVRRVSQGPSRKNQSSRSRTQHNAHVLVAPILRLSLESRTPTVSAPADYQPGAFPELNALSVPGLVPPPRSGLSTGVMPGAARTNWAHSSIKVSKVSSESTRRHGRPTPRPTTSKATLQPATGRTDTRAVSDSTICRSDTHVVSDTTTTRGYASATSPLKPQSDERLRLQSQ